MSVVYALVLSHQIVGIFKTKEECESYTHNYVQVYCKKVLR